jgi:hypothetical protein
MEIKTVSTAFTTNKVDESKEFYVKYLDAEITFDCGWYVNLKFKNDLTTLQFMTPKSQDNIFSRP